jgi:hypothetical protein
MKQDLHTRYRPLAGPFGPREIALALAIADRLRAGGCRILTQHERHGDRAGETIYRLRSECETTAETRQRLKAAH